MSEKAEKFENRWSNEQLWDKYETIAMHFNDLLIRLRMQALAAVAALITLAGVLGKSDVVSVKASWAVATAVCVCLAFFWVAIWAIDFLYYNRLLIGAVAAITKLEKAPKQERIGLIDISITIEQAVARELPKEGTWWRRCKLSVGRWAFYLIVFVTLAGGAAFSFWQWSTAKDFPRLAPVEIDVTKVPGLSITPRELQPPKEPGR